MDSPHQPTINEFGARYHRYLRYWDGILADQQYAGANEVSIADFAFYPVIFRSKLMIPEFTNDCPNIDRWYEEPVQPRGAEGPRFRPADRKNTRKQTYENRGSRLDF